jgi:hypothetical protein
MELTDSRKLNGWHLHPETQIVAAVNGGEECAGAYQVSELDPAELDRWVIWDINPTVEDWLTWAKDNVHTLVWDFINQNRNHLEHNEDPEPNKVYPSRRSWHRLNDCLVKGALVEDKGALDVVYHLATGYVGFEAAVAFKDFAKNYESQLTPEMVLAGDVERVKEMSVHKKNALTEKMVVFLGENELDDSQAENLAKLFGNLDAELAVAFWGEVAKAAPNALDKLHTKTVGDKPFGLYIADILA